MSQSIKFLKHLPSLQQLCMKLWWRSFIDTSTVLLAIKAIWPPPTSTTGRAAIIETQNAAYLARITFKTEEKTHKKSSKWRSVLLIYDNLASLYRGYTFSRKGFNTHKTLVVTTNRQLYQGICQQKKIAKSTRGITTSF